MSRIAFENDLIDRLAGALRWYGCGPVDVTADGDLVEGIGCGDGEEYDERIEYAHGHAGEGWYLGCGNYPDDGAEFIAPGEYGALLVAQAIVAEERAAIAESAARKAPEAGEASPAFAPLPPVSFKAQLMAFGEASSIDLAAQGCTTVLIFEADTAEIRKAGKLFREPVRLTAEVGA